MGLRLADRVLTVVEERRDQGGARAARSETLEEMIEGARAAGRNHRDADAVDDRTRQLDVVAEAGAVAVHAGEEDLAGSRGLHFRRPADGIDTGRRTPAVRVHLPAARGIAGDAPAGVDRHHDALR